MKDQSIEEPRFVTHKPSMEVDDKLLGKPGKREVTPKLSMQTDDKLSQDVSLAPHGGVYKKFDDPSSMHTRLHDPERYDPGPDTRQNPSGRRLQHSEQRLGRSLITEEGEFAVDRHGNRMRAKPVDASVHDVRDAVLRAFPELKKICTSHVASALTADQLPQPGNVLTISQEDGEPHWGISGGAFGHYVAGANVTIAAGKLLLFGIGMYSVGPTTVTVTGGTVGSPHWIIVRMMHGADSASIVYQSGAPQPESTSAYEIPLAEVYLSSGVAVVVSPRWHVGGAITIGATM